MLMAAAHHSISSLDRRRQPLRSDGCRSPHTGKAVGKPVSPGSATEAGEAGGVGSVRREWPDPRRLQIRFAVRISDLETFLVGCLRTYYPIDCSLVDGMSVKLYLHMRTP
jgi:hypothetical protein